MNVWGATADFLTCRRGWREDDLSQHFCVCQLKLQRQPKGGLTRFFVSFSWEQQVEAKLRFYFFTTGSYK